MQKSRGNKCNNTKQTDTDIKIIHIIAVATEYSTRYKLRPSSRQNGSTTTTISQKYRQIVVILLEITKAPIKT